MTTRAKRTAASPFDSLTITWKRHRSARAILSCFVRGMGVSLGDIVEIGGSTPDGTRCRVSLNEMLGGLETQGMWAFADVKAVPVTIHYWHDGKRTARELAFMLGHEAGHALESLPAVKDRRVSRERLADRAGIVAQLVVEELHRRAP